MHDFSFLVLLVGMTIFISILIKPAMERVNIPSLVSFLVLGLLIRLAGSHWNFFSEEVQEIYEFLGKIGVITLLFSVGVKSEITGLLSQLRNASLIWFGNVFVSGVFGYATGYFLLGLDSITSLIVGTAFTATSVGISVGIWEEKDAVDTSDGELLVDVAEMDDISGVIFMAILFAMAPVLKGGANGSLVSAFLKTFQIFLLKLLAFGALCVLFSRYIEQKMTDFFQKIEPTPELIILVIGTGVIIASLAGLLGFSVAIGAFFAGLAFSRDPKSIKTEASFKSICELFTPFFFINIGLSIEPHTLTANAFSLSLVLLVAAVLGKVIGTSTFALPAVGWKSSTLLGLSMVPRAEITMIIMQKGLKMGDWAVSSRVFSAMIIVCAITCIFTPLILHPLLGRWEQTEK